MPKPTILIADDDHDLVDLLTLRCRALGLSVETAADAIEALVKVDKTPPGAVILDVNMPSGGGLAVREMMVHCQRLTKIPVIVLTGNKDRETIQRCHNSCAYYVEKCPDVWQCIEPLLREFFPDIGIASSPPENSLATGPRGNRTSRIDSVFASLGWDDEYLADQGEATNIREVDGDWVLCIDDDDEFFAALRVRLERQGIQVLRASSGMAGYRYAFTSPARAILLDYHMPDGNGDYVLRRLKENPVTRDIPVIVLTGEKNHALARKMYNLGAAEYLTKPYTWETLWGAIQRVRLVRI